MIPAFKTRGPSSLPSSKRATRCRKAVGVVRHVARTGHAIGEIERAIDVAKVLVVVPQSRHQEPAVRVDDLGVGRWLQIGVRVDPYDAIAAHQNARPRSNTQVARIEEAGVTDDKIGFRNVGKFVRDPLDHSSSVFS